MKTCAIIIAAYNADKYILECYESVKNQIPLEGWEYEIRIGVDGKKIEQWTCGVVPEKIKIINHRAVYVWKF